jgi:hypothetical protein
MLFLSISDVSGIYWGQDIQFWFDETAGIWEETDE